MHSAIAAPYARFVALLGRHRRLVWSLLLLLLVGALYLHARSVRDDSIRELAINLDLGLDVTQADIDSWSASRRAHAELLARAVAEPRAAAAYDGLLRALLAGDGYEGAWIYDAAGKPIIGQSVPSRGAFLDFTVPIRDGGPPGSTTRGTIVLRAAPNDSTFPNLNPTRLSNRTARTTLLARAGDSVRVVATRSHTSTPSLPRVLAFASVPPYVRAAFAGQRSRGEGTGLFGQHVGYAARPALADGWVLVREMETQEFEDLMRGPIILQALIFGALAVLLAFVVANRARAASARRERELARLRTEFVASASHELRTPLAQIRMFSELLRSSGLRTPEDRDRALRVIEKESQRLSTLVDNLLNFAQLRRSVEPPRGSSTDIADEARQVIADFEPLTLERQVSIMEYLEPGLHARIDSRAFRQVLINFLENAVKYGPAGQTVTVRVGTSGSQLQLAVEDEGPGIPAAERSTVWQAFYRREDAVASRENGSGIGLAVVRDLVLQCGGSVRVEEAPGGGARFVAEFPRAEPAAR
jgi:signal transduction histidine kinase